MKTYINLIRNVRFLRLSLAAIGEHELLRRFITFSYDSSSTSRRKFFPLIMLDFKPCCVRQADLMLSSWLKVCNCFCSLFLNKLLFTLLRSLLFWCNIYSLSFVEVVDVLEELRGRRFSEALLILGKNWKFVKLFWIKLQFSTFRSAFFSISFPVFSSRSKWQSCKTIFSLRFEWEWLAAI